MAEIHNCLIVPKPGENLHVLTQRIDGYAIVPRPGYESLAARLTVYERALKHIGEYRGEGPVTTPWRNIVAECGATARAALQEADDGR